MIWVSKASTPFGSFVSAMLASNIRSYGALTYQLQR